MTALENANSKAKAKEQMIKSVRDLYTVKITLPLGNPNLKLVHTNQMLFTELPEDTFELANFGAIATALNSSYSRYSGYVLNRWYVEGRKITNDGKTAKMELELNPFASDVLKFRDEKDSFVKAYNDAQNTNKNTSNPTTNMSKTNKKVKSVSTIKLHNVKGQSKKDNAFLKSIVTKALKEKGNPKKPLAQAKAVYKYYQNNHVYKKYCCMSSGGFEKLWKEYGQNCGTGARTLCLMFKCLGLNCTIMNGHNHFWVRLNIDGKYYYCDQAGASGSHNKDKTGTSRVLSSSTGDHTVWGGASGGSNRGWNYVCGRYPCD